MTFLKQIFGHSLWTVSASVYNLVLQALLYLVITYYIAPSRLGLFALASAFVFIALAVIENAFPASLVQKGTVNRQDYNAVLFLNLGLTLLLWPIAIILSALTAMASDNMALVTLVATLGIMLPLSAYSSVQYAGLQRDMHFRVMSVIDIVCHTVFFLAAWYLAWLGLNEWALVLAFLIRSLFVNIIIVLWGHSYSRRPGEHSATTRKAHLVFGRYIILDKGLSTMISYADVFLVGHILGMQVLGIYDILKKIVMRPLLALYAAMEKIVYPILSSHRNRPQAYHNAYMDFTRLTAVGFTALLMLLAGLHSIILDLLPVAYSSYSSLLIALIFWCLSVILVNPLDILMYSVGHSRRFFIWFLLTHIVWLVLMYYSLTFGLSQMVMVLAGYNVFLYVSAYRLLLRPVTPLSAGAWFHSAFLSLPLALTVLCLYLMDVKQFEWVTCVISLVYVTGCILIIKPGYN